VYYEIEDREILDRMRGVAYSTIEPSNRLHQYMTRQLSLKRGDGAHIAPFENDGGKHGSLTHYALLRTLSPIEVSDETLDVEQALETVIGDGHDLARHDTLARMQTDFLYPDIADRDTYEVWVAKGSNDIRTIANRRAHKY